MAAWTSIAKPGPNTWTDNHPQGKEQYDESIIAYDSADTFYDGINPMQWTDIPKPTGSGLIRAGMATGLLMPLTYAREYSIDSWVKVNKPS